MFYKPEIRRRLRKQRCDLTPSFINLAAQKIVLQLAMCPEFIDAKTIAAYISDENEVDTQPILELIQHEKKSIYLPVMKNKMLEFYPYQLEEEKLRGRYGVREPDTHNKQALSPEILDLILLPLVAFDQHCHRIGRGAGCYDRALESMAHVKKNKPVLMGLAYEFQLIPPFDPNEWDVSLDSVMTEQTIYRHLPST